MRAAAQASAGRYIALPSPPPPRRFRPKFGQALTVECIRGHWRPSGTVAGTGMFAVVWTARDGDYWAPVHDFDVSGQLWLIEECRRIDILASGPGANSAGGD